MNLLIVGSRNFNDTGLLYQAFVKEYGKRLSYPDLRILSGGAQGADTLAKQLAMSLDIPFDEYPANWTLHGKAAGYIRNKTMVEEADYVMVFFGPPESDKPWPSKGALHTLQLARSKGLPVEVHYQSWKENQ